MRFSERHGLIRARTAIQLQDMDGPLRNGLWTAYQNTYVMTEFSSTTMGAKYGDLYTQLWFSFFKLPVDQMPPLCTGVHASLRGWFFDAPWNQVYDFIEFVAQNGQSFKHGDFIKLCNFVLERELSGYRLIAGQITPITDGSEIEAIDTGVEAAAALGLAGVREHLTTALRMLSDRSKPDYRNSVKESISAVEAIAKLIAGDPKADLARAIKKIDEATPVHGALRQAFLALYGYSSDEGGIRHALLDAPKVDFADAKYMLVTCSAFVTFLIQRAADAGITLK